MFSQQKKERKLRAQRDEEHLRNAQAEMEKVVINCLNCGKIYDTRIRSDENLKFMESGGICTFCGYHVSDDPSQGNNDADSTAHDEGINLLDCYFGARLVSDYQYYIVSQMQMRRRGPTRTGL